MELNSRRRVRPIVSRFIVGQLKSRATSNCLNRGLNYRGRLNRDRDISTVRRSYEKSTEPCNSSMTNGSLVYAFPFIISTTA